MFLALSEILQSSRPDEFGPQPTSDGAYRGRDRRRAASGTHVLKTVLDEIDYGLVLLDERERVVFVNHAARLELDASHPLVVFDDRLTARFGRDAANLQAGIRGAARQGLRKLLTLGASTDKARASVMPLPVAGEPSSHSTSAAAQTGHAVLLILGKRKAESDLSVAAFAREHALSSSEIRVLLSLCKGTRPADIAEHHGVAISTVRTQIGSIRAKTDTRSIRALVSVVSELPPMVGVLHRGRCGSA